MDQNIPCPREESEALARARLSAALHEAAQRRLRTAIAAGDPNCIMRIRDVVLHLGELRLGALETVGGGT